jgi:hypothetical protein
LNVVTEKAIMIDPETIPVHYRWRIAPGAAAATGVVASVEGPPAEHINGLTTCQFLRFDLVCNAALTASDSDPNGITGSQVPTGSNFIVDIDVSHDDGTTWASIFGSGPLPTLPAGRASASLTPPVGGPFVNLGDVLRANVLQVGSELAGQNILLTAYGRGIAD